MSAELFLPLLCRIYNRYESYILFRSFFEKSFFLFIFYFMAQFILKLTQLRRELTTTNKHQKNNLCLWCRRANRMDDENKLSSICLSSRAREFITR